MKTEEAVKWIFDIWHEWENVYGYDTEQNLKEGKKLDEVIALLRRGEKFETMWKELFVKEFTSELADMMMPIEQKYFPKETDKHEA